MTSFTEIVTSRYATVLFDFCFIFAFTGIYLVQKKRMLNSFQRYGMILLLIGTLFRIIILTVDYVHLLINDTHFIKRETEGVPDNLKLEVFIKAPEVLFEFPLLAIGLDWLELAILLKSTSEMTPESYLKTHKHL